MIQCTCRVAVSINPCVCRLHLCKTALDCRPGRFVLLMREKLQNINVTLLVIITVFDMLHFMMI